MACVYYYFTYTDYSRSGYWMKILICGGRDFKDKSKIYSDLDFYYNLCYENNESLSIISGMAKGADSLEWLYAKEHDLELFEFPADWKHHNNAAGPIRNKKMLDEGKPDLVLAYPTEKSVGTRHMIKIARQAGVKVIVYEGE